MQIKVINVGSDAEGVALDINDFDWSWTMSIRHRQISKLQLWHIWLLCNAHYSICNQNIVLTKYNINCPYGMMSNYKHGGTL